MVTRRGIDCLEAHGWLQHVGGCSTKALFRRPQSSLQASPRYCRSLPSVPRPWNSCAPQARASAHTCACTAQPWCLAACGARGASVPALFGGNLACAAGWLLQRCAPETGRGDRRFAKHRRLRLAMRSATAPARVRAAATYRRWCALRDLLPPRESGPLCRGAFRTSAGRVQMSRRVPQRSPCLAAGSASTPWWWPKAPPGTACRRGWKDVVAGYGWLLPPAPWVESSIPSRLPHPWFWCHVPTHAVACHGLPAAKAAPAR
jgi:hypothetical protein